jgi:RNA-binding protein YhbY
MPNDDNGSQSTDDLREGIEIIMDEGEPISAKVWHMPSLKDDFIRRSNEIQKSIQDSGDIRDFLRENQDTIVILFAIANELLTEQRDQLLTQELISNHIINDKSKDEKKLIDNLSEKQKDELIRHYNLVDDDNNVAEDIKKTIDYRNRVIHDPQKRYRIQDLDTLSERINTARDAIGGITEYINGDGN